MFSEVLKIKPVLDSSTAAAMEQNLSARFMRVAGRFGSGLKSVIKGSVLGISLGLLNKLLNPLEALDEKIKKLLGTGTDTKDLAEKLGTTGGKLKQAQDVAKSLGVSPEKFNEALSKFTDAADKAQEELANGSVEKSASTQIVGRFAGNKDRLEGFKSFLEFLKKTGEGDGTEQAFTTRASRALAEAQAKGQPLAPETKKELLKNGEIRSRTGLETQQAFVKDVLGDNPTGSFKRLINTNIDTQAKVINEPAVPKLDDAINKLSDLDAQKRVLDIQNETKDFISASQQLNTTMIAALAKSEARTEADLTKRLESYDDLKRGSDAVQDIQAGFSALLDNITGILGYLKDITAFIPRVTGSSFMRTIFGKKGAD